MEKYPVIIEGRTVGELRVTRDGARTGFEADCDMLEGVVRLAVFGGGRRGYLGVLAPRGGRLHLKRSLSPSELSSFPEQIERAGPADSPVEAESICGDSASDRRPEKEAAEKSSAKTGREKRSGGPVWRAAPGGALYCSAGARSLVALPAGDRRLLCCRSLGWVFIGGREYAVVSPETYRVIR